jgi:hypothetical protein
MTALLAGTPQPRPPFKVGDRVIILQRPESPGVDLSGWILNLTEGTIRIGANQDDDGRPFPPSDWWRKTFHLSEVTVVGVA